MKIGLEVRVDRGAETFFFGVRTELDLGLNSTSESTRPQNQLDLKEQSGRGKKIFFAEDFNITTKNKKKQKKNKKMLADLPPEVVSCVLKWLGMRSRCRLRVAMVGSPVPIARSAGELVSLAREEGRVHVPKGETIFSPFVSLDRCLLTMGEGATLLCWEVVLQRSKVVGGRIVCRKAMFVEDSEMEGVQVRSQSRTERERRRRPMRGEGEREEKEEKEEKAETEDEKEVESDGNCGPMAGGMERREGREEREGSGVVGRGRVWMKGCSLSSPWLGPTFCSMGGSCRLEGCTLDRWGRGGVCVTLHACDSALERCTLRGGAIGVACVGSRVRLAAANCCFAGQSVCVLAGKMETVPLPHENRVFPLLLSPLSWHVRRWSDAVFEGRASL